MIHGRILPEYKIKGSGNRPDGDRGEDIMDYIIVETIIVSVALAASVLKAAALIISEIAEDVREML